LLAAVVEKHIVFTRLHPGNPSPQSSSLLLTFAIQSQTRAALTNSNNAWDGIQGAHAAATTVAQAHTAVVVVLA